MLKNKFSVFFSGSRYKCTVNSKLAHKNNIITMYTLHSRYTSNQKFSIVLEIQLQISLFDFHLPHLFLIIHVYMITSYLLIVMLYCYLYFKLQNKMLFIFCCVLWLYNVFFPCYGINKG